MPIGSTLSGAAAGAELLLGGFEAISAAHELKQDKKELARLKQPFMKIQDEYFQNKNIAAEQAMSGMPSTTKNFLDTQRRQGLGTGIAALLESGVGPGEVGKLFQTYTDSISADAARDAEMRTRNIDYFIGVNKDLAGQKTNQFVVNELAPYERKLKQLTEKAATDKSNIFGGIGTAISGVSSLGTSLTNSDLLKGFSSKGGVSDSISGQKMWEDYKQEQERNNARQGDFTLPPKFSTDKPAAGRDYSVPEFSVDDLYNFLNRGR